MDEDQEQRDRVNNFATTFLALKQRQLQLERQTEIVAQGRARAAALEEQTKTLAKIERQRLAIEEQRFNSEEASRELVRDQVIQLKQLRNLMADADSRLAQFRRQHLS